MSFVATKLCFVATNVKTFCREKRNFVETKVLSRQTYFCRDKRRFLSRQKMILVAAPANDIAGAGN